VIVAYAAPTLPASFAIMATSTAFYAGAALFTVLRRPRVSPSG
jgi:hypothetical protein